MKNHVQLRYCQTTAMGADGLTKLAAATVLETLRQIMNGRLPPIPQAGDEFAVSRTSTMGGSTQAIASAVFGAMPIVSRRREAEYYAFQVLETEPHDGIHDQQLLEVLRRWGFAKNHYRQNVLPNDRDYVFSECFGLIRDRTGRWMPTVATTLYPNVTKVLNRWLRSRLQSLDDAAFDDPVLDWKWTSCTINKGYASRRHRDTNNYGPSIGRAFGSTKGDGLYYWGQCEKGEALESLPYHRATLLDLRNSQRMVMFDGTYPHETKKYQTSESERYSLVFFMTKKGWEASTRVHNNLLELGFNPATTEEEAETFEKAFDVLSTGRKWYQWTLPTSTTQGRSEPSS